MLKHRYPLIVLCLILTIIISPCCVASPNETTEESTPASSFLTYIDESNGFSIRYPSEWQKISDESSDSEVIGFSSPVSSLNSNATVTVSRIILPSEMTIGAFYDNLVKDIYLQPGYKLHIKQEQLLNNRPIIRLLYSFDNQELSFRGMRSLLVQNKYGWIISCISDPEIYNTLEPLFDRICNSFTLSNNVISITKPIINYFETNKKSIDEGDSVTLSWDVSDATSITILPMVSSVDLIGTKVLSPSQSTSCTLTAYNDLGSISRTIDIAVRSPDRNVVSYDPVTGRNSTIGFTWEQLGYASEYQVQIAKDPGFTLIVFDSGVFTPDSPTSPALLYGAGGVLEAGHTYYWRARVRGTVTGQAIDSPWSPPQRFVIGSGNPVTASYSGVQLLNPGNNNADRSIESTSFSWTPFKGTNKYRLTLSRKADMTDILVTAEVSDTSYVYDGELEYGTVYYWQVMALEPAPSDPSAVFSFTTEIQQAQEPAISEIIPDTPPEVPLWAWVLIGIGSLLIVVIIVYIFKARR